MAHATYKNQLKTDCRPKGKTLNFKNSKRKYRRKICNTGFDMHFLDTIQEQDP